LRKRILSMKVALRIAMVGSAIMAIVGLVAVALINPGLFDHGRMAVMSLVRERATPPVRTGDVASPRVPLVSG
jgi:hypothetical protein